MIAEPLFTGYAQGSEKGQDEAVFTLHRPAKQLKDLAGKSDGDLSQKYG